MNTRLAAARMLLGVVDRGQSLAQLQPGLPDAVAPQEQAFVRELVYGSLRWYVRLDALVNELVAKPLKARDRDMRCLLVIGLYQLSRMRVAPHAAVNETVQAARAADKPWAASLINGVLRNYQRHREQLECSLDRQVETRFSHPAWLIERLRRDWPDDWTGIVLANNEHPPMTLRVNLMRQDRDEWLQHCQASGTGAQVTPFGDTGVCLDKPVGVERLPGFRDGAVSVQDGAAQLAASLLDAVPGMRVLDACAAPGGKTAHILERSNNKARVTAVDSDAGRLQRVAENLQRLGLQADLVCADARRVETWWDGKPFDRILLDAPCSASGVIRRNPDIKRLRRPEDIRELAGIQGRLLDGLWPLLALNGMLLYATCSVFREENEGRIADFFARHSDASEDRITAGWGRPVQYGRQILPGEQGMDGFYYARLLKRAG